MHLRPPALAFALALAAAPAFAQSGPVNDLSKAEGGSFTLDKSHTKIIFATNHLGFSTFYGQFDAIEGKLVFDPKAPAKAAIEVTVAIDKINSSVPALDAHLKGADFFDAANFPTASFKATKIDLAGTNKGKITGDLTIRGVTRPLTLEASFIGGGISPASKAYVLGFSASGVVKRSEFGVKYGVPYVGDDVTLIISGEFNRIP